ncbi:hypothetical protein BKE38_28755 [Pseudoroseomonas deserti]|uniref:YcxB-like protein domain-containing protein n=1 Tax=Teichococcus deserti TaxID=1817963 RepID=A0A1V2GU88_9PROT|nr:hypothetical protein [Pseudoroseomonas deserti]ONG43661.1 hypothetical protein BKE38_28755 [Pseudoroseomonas deserti]
MGQPPQARRSSVPSIGAAAPRPVPPPGNGAPPLLEAGFAMTRADQLAGHRLSLRAQADAVATGLGGALLGGLVMLSAVLHLQAGETPLWKGTHPHGGTFAGLALLLAAAAALGWLAEARLRPWMIRCLVGRQLARMLPAGAPAAPARLLVAGEHVEWRSEGRVLRYEAALLRGMIEGDGQLVLRFGFGCLLVVPRAALDEAGLKRLRGWVAGHARGPIW